MKEPVDHIERPILPWREAVQVTECGLNAAKTPTISREQFKQRLSDWGRQRTAMTTCMTCCTTAQNWGTWQDDPRKAVSREIAWETAWSREERGDRLRQELEAIATLIANHRAEFDEIIASNQARKDWLTKKVALKNRAKANA